MVLEKIAEPQKVRAALPPLDVQKEERESIVEWSIFNQAALLFKRQDDYIRKCEEYLMSSINYDANATNLKLARESFDYALNPTLYGMQERDREAIENKLVKVDEKFRVGVIQGKGYGLEGYEEIRALLKDALKLIYRGNQGAGMGMPKESRAGVGAKMRASMQ